MKLATAAYPLDWFEDFAGYEAKVSAWVAQAAGAGAELLVFPEYGAMELASLAGAEVASDLEGSIRAVSGRNPISALIAAPVRPLARASSRRPSRMRTTITAAAS